MKLSSSPEQLRDRSSLAPRALQEVARGHLGDINAGVGDGWKNRQRLYAGLTPGVALPGSQCDKVELVKAMIADGRLSAAASGVALLEPFYSRLTSARLVAKVHWMRARLCRELQQFHAAQLAYERAYAILITEPRSPELATLAKEMAELEAAMSSSSEPETERK